MTIEAETTEAEAIKREELIGMLSDVGKKVYVRITAERFRARDDDELYLKFVRAWSSLAQTLNLCIRDEDLTELEKRIAALEEPEKTTEREFTYE